MPLLEHINLAGCDLEDQGLDVICGSLMKHEHIKHLDFSGNGLSEYGVSSDSPFIQLMKQVSTNLETLNMEDNALTSEGVRNMTDVFPRGSVLVELRLANTDCGSDCVHPLIQNIIHLLPTLKYLDLNDNFLSNEAKDRLRGQFGDVLQKLDDNVDDSDFQDVSQEEEEEEKEEDLTQMLF